MAFEILIPAANVIGYNAYTDAEYDVEVKSGDPDYKEDDYVKFSGTDLLDSLQEEVNSGTMDASFVKKLVKLLMEDDECRTEIVKIALAAATKELDGRDKTIMKLAADTWKKCTSGCRW